MTFHLNNVLNTVETLDWLRLFTPQGMSFDKRVFSRLHLPPSPAADGIMDHAEAAPETETQRRRSLLQHCKYCRIGAQVTE